MTTAAQQRMPRYVYPLLGGQAINLGTEILTATVAPIMGLNLAPSPALTTIPYDMQFLGLFLGALPFAKLMNKYGRFSVFMLGGALLLAGGILGYLGIEQSNFWLFSFSQLLIGLFVSTGNCYRFAATDGLPDSLVTRSGTFVIAGGLLASAIAPFFATELKEVQGFATFSAIYLLITLLALILFVLLNLWHRQFKKHHITPRAAAALETSPVRMSAETKTLVALGITASSMCYFIKTFMLVSAIMYLRTHYDYQYLPYTVPLHVGSMFLPAFIVPYIISKAGKTTVTVYGFLLLATACMLPLIFSGTLVINASLVLLGFGFNYAYSSATAIIGCVQGAARLKIQGYNEAAFSLMGTVGAFLPGAALGALGWEQLSMATLGFTMCLVVVLTMLARRARMLSVSGAVTQAA